MKNFYQVTVLTATAVILLLCLHPASMFAQASAGAVAQIAGSGNDMIALGVLAAIRDAGLRCPQDVSVIGFDDLELAETTNPALSSVSQSGYQLGSTAASILLERIKGYTGPPKHIVLETSLKLRDSVAPPTPVRPVRRANAGNHRAARS